MRPWQYGKLGVIILGIVVLFLAAIPGLRFFNKWRAERAAHQLEQELLRPYMEDTVGGKTPEETFGMFLEALKKEDVELAAKYFVIDKQEEWRKDLKNIKQNKTLEEMIADLSRPYTRENFSDTTVNFHIANEKNQLIALVSITKQPNGIWKMRSL